MKTLLAILLVSGSSSAATFQYEFVFNATSRYSAATITYTSADLAPLMPSLSYLSGSVNGCAPTAAVTFELNATDWRFHPKGGSQSPDCTGSTGDVVGFDFYVASPFHTGTFQTNSAGRAIATPGGFSIDYATGSLTISQPSGTDQVPEPGNFAPALSALALLAVLRKRSTS